MNIKKDTEFFTENDIRPDSLEAEQKKRFESDIKSLLKHKTSFVYITCPACGSNDSAKVFEKYHMDYVKCPKCNTVYINPRPTPEILRDYYKTSENYSFWNNYIFPASEDTRREKIFRPRVERIVDICKNYRVVPETLLEVGSGFGTFCEEAKKNGFFKRIISVEPAPDLAATCKKKGLEVIEKPIEEVEFKDRAIDIVVSFEVIEHLFLPGGFLKSCNRILKKDGLIVLTCPNIDGFDISLLGPVSDAVDVEHLNYFNIGSLSTLLKQHGFKMLESVTPGRLDAELVRKKILSNEFDIRPHPFLKQILIDRWDELSIKFQQFLIDNKLSSHMWIVGQKI